MLRRRLAWSRNGLLAYINHDRQALVTWLVCTDGQRWDCAAPLRVPLPAEADPACLSWAPTGSDLAVCDTAGRVHIVGLSSIHEPQTYLRAAAAADAGVREEEAERVVSMHWLSLDKSLLVPHPSFDTSLSAAKSWEQLPSRGPFPPVRSRNVLVALNVRQRLRIFVQAQSHEYTEFGVQVPSAANAVHAEFVQNGAALILFVIGVDNVMRSFEVRLRFEIDNIDQKIDLSVFPIACCTLEIQPAGITALPSPDNVRIRVLGRDGQVSEYLMRSSVESLNAAFLELFAISQPVLPEPRLTYSLEPGVERPAIKLEQQGLRSDTAESEGKESVRYLQMSRFLLIVVHKSGVVRTEPLYGGAHILQPDKAGLSFDAEDIRAAKYLAFSPLAVCAATLDRQGAVKILTSRTDDAAASRLSAVQIGRVFATMYACTVLNSEQCDDVLSCAWLELHNERRKAEAQILFSAVAAESQRLLNVNLSPPEDQRTVDRLVVIPSPPQRWLSFLVSLGTRDKWKRGAGCRVALTILHLQLCAFGLTWTVKKISQSQKTDSAEKLRNDVLSNQFYIVSMIAPIRWITDLCTRILQELFDAQELGAEGRPDTASRLLGQPNVCMALLMSSIARYLLRYVLRGIRTLTASAKNVAGIENRLNSALAVEEKKRFLLRIQQQAQEFAQKNPGAPLPPELNPKDTVKLQEQLRARLAKQNGFVGGQALRLLTAQLQGAPFPLEGFEKFLLDIEEGVKTLFSRANSMNPSGKRRLEADIIDHACVSDSFYSPLVAPMLQAAQKHVFDGLDMPTFYFHNTDWLELDSDRRYNVDGLSKKPLLPTDVPQVCSRCGMLTVSPSEKPMMHWLYIFHRYCICGGTWMKPQMKIPAAEKPRD